MKSKRKQHCEFCAILEKSQTSQPSEKLLYLDDYFFVFYDIDKSTARQHILVCTREHIETATDIWNKEILLRMREVGADVLDKICREQNFQTNYRFGFHLKPFNSIDHVHLHCFVLPFSSLVKDKIVYGKMLTPIEELIDRIEAQPHPRF